MRDYGTNRGKIFCVWIEVYNVTMPLQVAIFGGSVEKVVSEYPPLNNGLPVVSFVGCIHPKRPI